MRACSPPRPANHAFALQSLHSASPLSTGFIADTSNWVEGSQCGSEAAPVTARLLEADLLTKALITKQISYS